MKIDDIVGDISKHSLDELKEFQGALKNLTKENYEKAKRNILKNGFAAPFYVYKRNNELALIDGHQRLRTLLEMRSEGIAIPEKFPCVEIKAKDESHARELILAYNSQYGEMTDEGLYEFIFTNGLDYSDIVQETRLPDIDLKKFEAKFFDAEQQQKEELETCSKCGGKIRAPKKRL